MKLVSTPLNDLYIIEPKVFEDDRGYFYESYNKSRLHQLGLDATFVQDNQSKSSFGVIRGLHFQREPKAQTKLVRVTEGRILDVAVDCRKGSPTFGKWFGIELSAENKKQLFIPKGFAHGFSVLSQTAVVFYKCDEFYAPEFDGGIIYNDPKLKIDWQIPIESIVISDKDGKLPTFKTVNMNFNYPI
jgi:dTDP-4-dehydrorhamnose 3,5-epimerase